MRIRFTEGPLQVGYRLAIRPLSLQQQSQLQVDLTRAREGRSKREYLPVGLFRTGREAVKETRSEGGKSSAFETRQLNSLFVLPVATVDDAKTIKEGGVRFAGGRESTVLAVRRVGCVCVGGGGGGGGG